MRLRANLVISVAALFATTALGCNYASPWRSKSQIGMAKQPTPVEAYAQNYASQNTNLEEAISNDTSVMTANEGGSGQKSNRSIARNSGNQSCTSGCCK